MALGQAENNASPASAPGWQGGGSCQIASFQSEAQAQTLGLGTGQVWTPLLLTISTSESRM